MLISDKASSLNWYILMTLRSVDVTTVVSLTIATIDLKFGQAGEYSR